MERDLQVRVFGKPGCSKCAVLKSRLQKILALPEFARFDETVFELHTEDGLVEFAEMECLNPNRLPAFVVCRQDPAGVSPLPNPEPGATDDVCGKARLYQHLGLQTDYSTTGKGVLDEAMIRQVLTLALEQCAAA